MVSSRSAGEKCALPQKSMSGRLYRKRQNAAKKAVLGRGCDPGFWDSVAALKLNPRSKINNPQSLSLVRLKMWIELCRRVRAFVEREDNKERTSAWRRWPAWFISSCWGEARFRPSVEGLRATGDAARPAHRRPAHRRRPPSPRWRPGAVALHRTPGWTRRSGTVRAKIKCPICCARRDIPRPPRARGRGAIGARGRRRHRRRNDLADEMAGPGRSRRVCPSVELGQVHIVLIDRHRVGPRRQAREAVQAEGRGVLPPDHDAATIQGDGNALEAATVGTLLGCRVSGVGVLQAIRVLVIPHVVTQRHLIGENPGKAEVRIAIILPYRQAHFQRVIIGRQHPLVQFEGIVFVHIDKCSCPRPSCRTDTSRSQ